MWVDLLEDSNEMITVNIRNAGSILEADVGNDVIVDGISLARTASAKIGNLQTHPEMEPEDDPVDPKGLPIKMLYAPP